MISLSLNELKLLSKSRVIKDYESKSKDKLMKILSKPKPKISLRKRLQKIREKFNELRDTFS